MAVPSGFGAGALWSIFMESLCGQTAMMPDAVHIPDIKVRGANMGPIW